MLFFGKFLRSGGLGDLLAIILQVTSHFSLELLLEAGVLDVDVDLLDQVFGHAAAQFAAFEADIPLMQLFFPFVALVLKPQFFLFPLLRFEAIFGFACFGS